MTIEQDQVVPVEQEQQEIKDQRPTEKMLPASRVSELIRDAKRDAVEKGRREALEEAKKAAKESSENQNSSVSDEQIRRMIDEQANRKLQEERQRHFEAEGARIANEFSEKLYAAKDKYPDFEDVLSQIEFDKIPNVVLMANEMDNTADIVYDIAKNPSKYASFMVLSNTSPKLAKQDMKRLSASIKQNQEAIAKEKKTSEPLSHLKPSITGKDSGNMTIGELRRSSKYRA